MFQPSEKLTADNAKVTLEAGLRAIEGGQLEIDLLGLKEVDSSSVATLLAWQRAAHAKRQVLTFQHLPATVQSLAELYGVADLLHLAAA